MIEFKCSQCGKHLKVKDEVAGRKGKCPQCGTTLEVPVPAADGNIVEVGISIAPGSQHDAPDQNVQSSSPPATQPPPLGYGHVAQVVSINANIPNRTSSLGVVSLILGVVAMLLCWIPFIGIFSIPLSLLGILLAGIGLLAAIFRRGSGIGWPIGGVAVSGLALIIGFSQLAVIGGTAKAIADSTEQANRTRQEVVSAGVPGDLTQATSDNPPTAERDQTRPDEPKWASAKDAVRQGDIQLRITQVVAGKVPLRSMGRKGQSDSNLLAIHLDIQNLGNNKKFEYRSWSGQAASFIGSSAKLRDNFGNKYKLIDFGLVVEVVGHIESGSIYPGKIVSDVLVFELPIGTFKHLDLELPGDNFGGEGMLRLRIPADMVHTH